MVMIVNMVEKVIVMERDMVLMVENIMAKVMVCAMVLSMMKLK